MLSVDNVPSKSPNQPNTKTPTLGIRSLHLNFWAGLSKRLLNQPFAIKSDCPQKKKVSPCCERHYAL